MRSKVLIKVYKITRYHVQGDISVPGSNVICSFLNLLRAQLGTKLLLYWWRVISAAQLILKYSFYLSTFSC